MLGLLLLLVWTGEFRLLRSLFRTSVYMLCTRIGDETSAKLSIQTPWGQVRPKFMPEGVAPASIYLQDKMREIFHDMPTVIYMWDNILVLGHDQENLVDNLIPSFFYPIVHP